MIRRRLEHASLDRIGLACLAGGLATGTLAPALHALGGGHDVAALLLVWGLVSVVATPVVALLGGLLWVMVRRIGLTGPTAAIVAGVVASLMLGVLLNADADMLGAASARYRWISALATGIAAAPPGIAVALLMWRVAYRRLG